MRRPGNNLRKFFWDLLFPLKCLGCGREGDWLCPPCRGTLKINLVPACPVCGLANTTGAVCHYCRDDSYLDGLWVALDNNFLVKELIHALKYRFAVALLAELEPKLIESLEKNSAWRDFFVLVPVPLQRRRYLERGFNQSQLIAERISRAKGNPLNNSVLKRIKPGHPQVGLNAISRRQNIVGSFRAESRRAGDLNKLIVLVDDVYTTGATLQECAKELKKVGYQKVWGLTLVRG